MKKRNGNTNSDFTLYDRYQTNQINNNNQPIYPKNNFDLYIRIGLDLGRNNYQTPNYNVNSRNNINANNINSNPVSFVDRNSLGNPYIKQSNEHIYRKRYSYSFNNDQNAGDIFNPKGMNENVISVNKNEIDKIKTNFQDYQNSLQRKNQPINYKDYNINNRPESANNQYQHKNYHQFISYVKKIENYYKIDDLRPDVVVKNIINIQKSKEVKLNQEHKPIQNIYINNNQMKQKQNNNSIKNSKKIIDNKNQKNFGEKNRINKINDNFNKLNERKIQNIGNNFRINNNKKNNNAYIRYKNQINNNMMARPFLNEKPLERIFNKGFQRQNKNNGEPIKIKSFKDFDKNEKQKIAFNNQNNLNRNNNLNKNYNIFGPAKKCPEEKQKYNNRKINNDNHNIQDKNIICHRNHNNYFNEMNKKIDNNKRDYFSKLNLDKFKNDKNNNKNIQQKSCKNLKELKNDISNQINMINNRSKKRNFSEDKVINNHKKLINQIFSDKLKKEQNKKQKKEFDFVGTTKKHEQNKGDEQIWEKFRSYQKEQKSNNYIKEDLISTKMVLEKENNQINKNDNTHDYLYDVNDGYTKRIIQPILNKEKNIQDKKQQQQKIINNFFNNNNNNFNNNNKINSNDNFINNKNNNNIGLNQNENINKEQNPQQQNIIVDLKENNTKLNNRLLNEIDKNKNVKENKDNSLKNKIIDDLIKLIIEKDKIIKELKEKISLYNFELNKGEKLISIIIITPEQNYVSIICKNTNKFTKVEEILYEKYNKYENTENYFILRGKKINKYHDLDSNNIKDGDIIQMHLNEIE